MNKEIIDKYFRNQATPEEVESVLEWFETPEGQKYLQERMDIDFDFMEKGKLKPFVPELDSERLYGVIYKRIKKKPYVSVKAKSDWLAGALKAAAVAAIIIITSIFYMIHHTDGEDKITELAPVVFQTDDVQQSIITLRDGSEVRLNHNSELIVSENFLDGTREVVLKGEAYFEIENNAEQPFIIHANQSTVEVLGTAFNVRSHTNANNVQVAVVDGTVSFANLSGEEKIHSVVLSKGQYGYLDLEEQTIVLDEIAIENYLAWKNGRLVFKELRLSQVCTQLQRLYQISCSFENDEFRDLLLTADFSNDSLEKTLSVISLTLNIDFKLDENQVYWSHPDKSEV